MVKPVAHGVFHQAERGRRRQLVLGLTDKFRTLDENRQEQAGMAHDIFGGDFGGFLVSGQFPEIA